MRQSYITTTITLFALLVLSGCRANSTREIVEASLLLNHEVIGLSDRSDAFEGVAIAQRSPKGLKEDGSITAVEGQDIELDYMAAVFTCGGAFVQEGGIGLQDDDETAFLGLDITIEQQHGWDIINSSGQKIGRLFDDDFGADVWGGHARRNWSYIDGYESRNPISKNRFSCCVTFMSSVKLPFSEIDPTGHWGTVKIPLWVSVFYYDIFEQRYEKVYRKFDLTIHFEPSPAISSSGND